MCVCVCVCPPSHDCCTFIALISAAKVMCCTQCSVVVYLTLLMCSLDSAVCVWRSCCSHLLTGKTLSFLPAKQWCTSLLLKIACYLAGWQWCDIIRIPLAKYSIQSSILRSIGVHQESFLVRHNRRADDAPADPVIGVIIVISSSNACLPLGVLEHSSSCCCSNPNEGTLLLCICIYAVSVDVLTHAVDLHKTASR